MTVLTMNESVPAPKDSLVGTRKRRAEEAQQRKRKWGVRFSVERSRGQFQTAPLQCR